MTTSKKLVLASLLLGALVIGAKSAKAEGFKFKGGDGNSGGSKSSFKINWGANNSNHNQNKNGSPFKKDYDWHHDDHHNDGHHHHHGHHHHKYWKHNVRYVEPVRYVYSKCYYPTFQCCYVYPGDTWYSISQRVYGVDFLCKHIASYNGLSMSSQLVAGQMLRLPVVNPNGSLATSTAPMPAPYVQAALIEATTAAVTPAANIRTLTEEPTLPKVTPGSTLMVDAASLGSEKGSVRLDINGMVLPVEVVEWSNNSVKVQLPKVDLSRAVKADLNVLRADGSSASSSAVELIPTATRVALEN